MAYFTSDKRVTGRRFTGGKAPAARGNLCAMLAKI
jgi:hypothetical protein